MAVLLLGMSVSRKRAAPVDDVAAASQSPDAADCKFSVQPEWFKDGTLLEHLASEWMKIVDEVAPPCGDTGAQLMHSNQEHFA